MQEVEHAQMHDRNGLAGGGQRQGARDSPLISKMSSDATGLRQLVVGTQLQHKSSPQVLEAYGSDMGNEDLPLAVLGHHAAHACGVGAILLRQNGTSIFYIRQLQTEGHAASRMCLQQACALPGITRDPSAVTLQADACGSSCCTGYDVILEPHLVCLIFGAACQL